MTVVARANSGRKPMSAYFVNGRMVSPAADQAHLVVRGLYGLGDNIYQRAFLRDLPETVWLDTPWPEVYQDLPHVKCVRSHTDLRTQALHVSSIPYQWASLPKEYDLCHIHYDNYDLECIPPFSIPGGVGRRLGRFFDGIKPHYDLPAGLPHSRHPGCAIVRPVTIRREWFAQSRACDPTYIDQACKVLNAAGYTTVSVAHDKPDVEWSQGAEAAQIKYNKGELNVLDLMALFQEAAVVVTPVCFALPMAAAARARTAAIFGGYGGHNSPNQVLGEGMDLAKIKSFVPDNHCKCIDIQHTECNKTITNFQGKFEQWLKAKG